MTRILVFDNDECTGFYTPTSLIHNLLYSLLTKEFLGPYSKTEILDATAKALGETYMKTVFMRPGMDIFLQQVYKLKKEGKIDVVVMYTFAADTSNSYLRFLSHQLCTACNVPYDLFDIFISRSIQEKDMVPYHPRFIIKKQLQYVRRKVSEFLQRQITIADPILMYDDQAFTVVESWMPGETIVPSPNVISVRAFRLTFQSGDPLPSNMWTFISYRIGEHLKNPMFTCKLVGTPILSPEGQMTMTEYFKTEFFKNFTSSEPSVEDTDTFTVFFPALYAWLGMPMRTISPQEANAVLGLLRVSTTPFTDKNADAIMQASLSKCPIKPLKCGELDVCTE